MISLQPEETVVAEVRKHWYVLFAQTLGLCLLAFVPIVAIVALDVFGVSGSTAFTSLALFATGFWLLAVWLVFFITWTNYYLDVWVITTKRIIDIEQKGLFSRTVAECRLEKVQDVSVDVHGLLATFFRFGNVRIQTAGESGNFILPSIPDPQRVKDIIFREQERQMGERRPQAAANTEHAVDGV